MFVVAARTTVMIQRLCVPFPTHLLTIRSAFSKFSYPTIVVFLVIVVVFLVIVVVFLVIVVVFLVIVVVFLVIVVVSVLAFGISLTLCLRCRARNYARLG
jgi:hypothetical protein